MKLSELLKRLYEESEYTSVSSLSNTTGIDKGLINRTFAGENTAKKLDILFEELTKGLEVKDFIFCQKLIEQIRLREVEQNQIL